MKAPTGPCLLKKYGSTPLLHFKEIKWKINSKYQTTLLVTWLNIMQETRLKSDCKDKMLYAKKL